MFLATLLPSRACPESATYTASDVRARSAHRNIYIRTEHWTAARMIVAEERLHSEKNELSAIQLRLTRETMLGCLRDQLTIICIGYP